MQLRHIRYFIALAEELHFTRAAARLYIEQPPLSRAIKELEENLGVVLFNRDRRGTRLTAAGVAFLQDARRLFRMLDQAEQNVKAVAAGLRGNLHVAISDGAIDPRLSMFLARCRADEPELEIHLAEVPLAEQLRGLRSGDFAIGLAHTADVAEDILTEPIWSDRLAVVIPAKHPLLAFKEIPVSELVKYPLVLCDPQLYEGYFRELSRVLLPMEHKLNVVGFSSSLDMMLTLVGAGYGIGFTTASRIKICQRPDVVIRFLASESAEITTYLLRALDNDNPSASLQRVTTLLRG